MPPSDPASIPSLLKTPTAANLIRVFGLQERLKSLGKEGEFKAAHVHVVGAGTMGGDIAAWCALRGLTVTLQDQNAERLAPAMGRAAKLFAERLRDPRRVRDATDRLIPDVAGDGVARADVDHRGDLRERRREAQPVRRARGEGEARRDPRDQHVVAFRSRTSRRRWRDPTRLIGLHFFNPVPKMMLVEIVVGAADATPSSTAPAAAFVRQIDQLPLPVKSAPGFLVNRVLAPYLMAAMRCVDEGIAPETVDEAALAFGMPMGPIELADTVGLDICVAVGKMLTPDADAAEEADRARRGGPPRPQDQARLLRLRERQAGEAAGRRRAGRTRRPPHRARSSPKRRRRSPKASSPTPISSMRARSSAPGFAPFRGGPLHYARAHARRAERVDARGAGVARRRLLV